MLIFGFGPFPGVHRNPAESLARALGKLRRPALSRFEREVVILPTLWASLNLCAHTICAREPDLVLLIGVATRRRTLCLETRAVNRAGPMADAHGRHFPHQHLSPAGRNVLWTGLDLPRLLAAARRSGLPARASRDAGRYLCNAAYYRALETLAEQGRPGAALFIHVPGTPAGRWTSPVGQDRAAAALAAILAALPDRPCAPSRSSP